MKPGPFRVAMVVASPFPANHGTPGSIREMAEALAARGHEVHIATYHFGEGTPPHGVQLHRIPDLGLKRQIVVGPTWQKPLFDLQLVFTLARLVWRQRIDVIHAHNYEGALVGFAARLLTGRPLVYNAINTMIDELGSYGFLPRGISTLLARTLDYWVPRLPAVTIALSDELAVFLRAQGIPDARIHVIPLGVDTGIFDAASRAEARQQLNPQDRPLVVYTGILDRLQRIDYLLQAMRVVVDARPEARLLIVANTIRGDDVTACQAEIAQRGLAANVEIVPCGSFEEIPRFLAAADVTVVPRPRCPGFPVKLLNYLAAGRPVVVFAGSAKGLVHGESAMVAPDDDARALGEGILAVLGDPALAARLGRNARRFVEANFGWPVLAERTLDVYRQLVRRPSASAS